MKRAGPVVCNTFYNDFRFGRSEVAVAQTAAEARASIARGGGARSEEGSAQKNSGQAVPEPEKEETGEKDVSAGQGGTEKAAVTSGMGPEVVSKVRTEEMLQPHVVPEAGTETEVGREKDVATGQVGSEARTEKAAIASGMDAEQVVSEVRTEDAVQPHVVSETGAGYASTGQAGCEHVVSEEGRQKDVLRSEMSLAQVVEVRTEDAAQQDILPSGGCSPSKSQPARVDVCVAACPVHCTAAMREQTQEENARLRFEEDRRQWPALRYQAEVEELAKRWDSAETRRRNRSQKSFLVLKALRAEELLQTLPPATVPC